MSQAALHLLFSTQQIRESTFVFSEGGQGKREWIRIRNMPALLAELSQPYTGPLQAQSAAAPPATEGLRSYVAQPDDAACSSAQTPPGTAEGSAGEVVLNRGSALAVAPPGAAAATAGAAAPVGSTQRYEVKMVLGNSQVLGNSTLSRVLVP